MVTQRKILLVVISILVIGIIVYFALRTEEKSSLRLAVDQGAIVSAPVFVAQERKLWSDYGLNVEVISFKSGRDALQALLGGNVDVATMAATPFILGVLQGHKLQIISTIVESKTDAKIVARKDHGISSPQDLIGKKVGILIGSTSDFFLHLFLKKYKIDRGKLEIINFNPPDLVQGLVRGDIDAISIWEPHGELAFQKLGSAAIIFSDADVFVETFNIVTTQQILEQKKHQIINFLSGLIDAQQFINKNHEESIKIVAQATNVMPILIKQVWKNYNFAISLTPDLKKFLELQLQWSLNMGLAKIDINSLNVDLFIVKDFLEAAMSGKSTIK